MEGLRGAATLPGRHRARVSVSWPLAELTVTSSNLRIAIRPRWLAVALHRLAHLENSPDAAWTADWDGMSRVLLGPRSVVLVPRVGRACRFATLTRRRLEPLVVLLEGHGVPIERVRTTMAKAFTI